MNRRPAKLQPPEIWFESPASISGEIKGKIRLTHTVASLNVLSSKLTQGLAFRNVWHFKEFTFSASLPPSILYLGLNFKVFSMMRSCAVIASSIEMSE
jgi:hypothetical protein